MDNYILDTDTLIHLYAGHPRVAERLRTVDDPDVGTPIITKLELLRGRIDFVLKASAGAEILRAQELFVRTEELLAQIAVVPFTQASAEHFERLRAGRVFRKVGHADLLIASIVLGNRATLVTRNVRRFKQIPGLLTGIGLIDSFLSM
ncbi:MAG: type II toxin-antitoxin system VapC family toxin [Anaerolineae bacterium]|nr:type II toxin-antitoxin system VapC family toxin [Anaerolineae bacterium]